MDSTGAGTSPGSMITKWSKKWPNYGFLTYCHYNHVVLQKGPFRLF
jgi:hypothetical protein